MTTPIRERLEQGWRVGKMDIGVNKRNRQLEWLHWLASLGALLAIDKALDAWFQRLGIKFPSALAGMFLLIGVLSLLSGISSHQATSLSKFFQPGLAWIQTWLPLFYLAPLVVLPHKLGDLSSSDLMSMLVIVALGWVANLWVTGTVVFLVRKVTRREAQDVHSSPPSTEISTQHHIAWTVLAISSLVLASVFPRLEAPSGIVFMLSITVLGYLAGKMVPPPAARLIHPIVVCASVAHVGSGAFGVAMGWTWNQGVDAYLPEDGGGWSAGGLLMSFLGSVILSFGFSIFSRRSTMMHHFWEMFAGIATCSLFSMTTSALMGRLLGLSPALTVAVIPKSITVALALPVADTLGSNLAPVTAGAVVLTGLLGANFSEMFLNLFGMSDPIIRGISSASCGHGLATSAMGSREPETLPYCSLAYSLSGILGTLFVQIPVIKEFLLALAGA